MISAGEDGQLGALVRKLFTREPYQRETYIRGMMINSSDWRNHPSPFPALEPCNDDLFERSSEILQSFAAVTACGAPMSCEALFQSQVQETAADANYCSPSGTAISIK